MPDAFNSSAVGVYSDDALLSLAHEHDPGFDRVAFARQLTYVAQLNVRDTVRMAVSSRRHPPRSVGLPG